MGEKVLPDWFNIEEKPHLLRGLASSPFDSEGVYTKDANIITDGVLATYLLTSYSARKLNMDPTGHAGVFTTGLLSPQGRTLTPC